MDEGRTTPEPENESQVRRAQRGVVAGYIHEMSERHAEHAQADTESPDEAED